MSLFWFLKLTLWLYTVCNSVFRAMLIVPASFWWYMSTSLFVAGTSWPPLKADTLRLYSMRFCPYAQRARLVLAHKHIPLVSLVLAHKHFISKYCPSPHILLLVLLLVSHVLAHKHIPLVSHVLAHKHIPLVSHILAHKHVPLVSHVLVHKHILLVSLVLAHKHIPLVSLVLAHKHIPLVSLFLAHKHIPLVSLVLAHKHILLLALVSHVLQMRSVSKPCPSLQTFC